MTTRIRVGLPGIMITRKSVSFRCYSDYCLLRTGSRVQILVRCIWECYGFASLHNLLWVNCCPFHCLREHVVRDTAVSKARVLSSKVGGHAYGAWANMRVGLYILIGLMDVSCTNPLCKSMFTSAYSWPWIYDEQYDLWLFLIFTLKKGSAWNVSFSLLWSWRSTIFSLWSMINLFVFQSFVLYERRFFKKHKWKGQGRSPYSIHEDKVILHPAGCKIVDVSGLFLSKRFLRGVYNFVSYPKRFSFGRF